MKITKRCEVCNKIFFKSINTSKKNWEIRRFCSKKCWATPKGKWFSCEICGKKFYRYPVNIKAGIIKRCSVECYANARKGKPNPTHRFYGHNVVYKCEGCGKETKTKLAVYNKAKHHFCSPECSNMFNGELHSKENHWNWKGGITKPNHRARTNTAYRHWQKAVFERDGFTCQNCGSKEKLEAHHILGFKEYEQKRYEIENGLTLCKSCHVKYA